MRGGRPRGGAAAVARPSERDGHALYCDLDGDQKLDVEEWYAMQTAAVRASWQKTCRSSRKSRWKR